MATSAQLGEATALIEAELAHLARERVAMQVWAADHTLWKPNPTELTNCLGWLTAQVTVCHQPPTTLGILGTTSTSATRSRFLTSPRAARKVRRRPR